MNSPKLTNALLIALVAINGLLLIGLMMKSAHVRGQHNYAMHCRFNRRHHSDFAFRYHRGESFRGHHRGHGGGEFRNNNGSGQPISR